MIFKTPAGGDKIAPNFNYYMLKVMFYRITCLGIRIYQDRLIFIQNKYECLRKTPKLLADLYIYINHIFLKPVYFLEQSSSLYGLLLHLSTYLVLGNPINALNDSSKGKRDHFTVKQAEQTSEDYLCRC